MIGDSASNPIRISALNTLNKCQGFFMLDNREGSSGAADTGTALGRCVEMWHEDGEPEGVDSFQAIVAKVKLEAPVASRPFSMARWDEVEAMFLGYAQDPRNRGVVDPASLEQTVTLTLPPHSLDTSGRPVFFEGHLDQTRRSGSWVEVWDLKSGKASGPDMVADYSPQLAFYTLALAAVFPKVRVGGIIRSRGYICRGKPNPGEHNVLFPAPLSLSTCKAIANQVLLRVAMVRNQEALISPGGHCNYCPAGSVSRCTEQLLAMGITV